MNAFSISGFVASNGVTVTNLGGNWDQSVVRFESDRRPDSSERDMRFEDCDIVALREAFLAKEDERLGRWRWPENPEYVVYPTDVARGRMVRVFNERGQQLCEMTDGGAENAVLSGAQSEFARAARSYFDAHPEPWHDAKLGEVWVVTHEEVGEVAAVKVRSGHFDILDGRDGGYIALKDVTAGRRIWPEETP